MKENSNQISQKQQGLVLGRAGAGYGIKVPKEILDDNVKTYEYIQEYVQKLHDTYASKSK